MDKYQDFLEKQKANRVRWARKKYPDRVPFGNRVKIPEEERQQKIRARRQIFVELRAGNISQKPCEVCGTTKSEAHHPDYSQPLNIIWLCKKHHREAHRFIDNIPV